MEKKKKKKKNFSTCPKTFFASWICIHFSYSPFSIVKTFMESVVSVSLNLEMRANFEVTIFDFAITRQHLIRKRFIH